MHAGPAAVAVGGAGAKGAVRARSALLAVAHAVAADAVARAAARAELIGDGPRLRRESNADDDFILRPRRGSLARGAVTARRAMARAVEARAVGRETSAVIRARAQSAVVPSPSRLACAFIAIAMAAAAAARRTNYRHLAARAVSTAAVGEAGADGAVAAAVAGVAVARAVHASAVAHTVARASTQRAVATRPSGLAHARRAQRRALAMAAALIWAGEGGAAWAAPAGRARADAVETCAVTVARAGSRRGARTLAEGAVRPSKAGAAHAAVIDASSIERAGAIAWARANGAIGAVVPWLAVARPVVAAPVVCAAVDARSQTAVMTGEAGRASRSYNDGAIDAGVAGCARAHPILAYSLGRALHSFGVRETKAQRKCTHVGRKEGE